MGRRKILSTERSGGGCSARDKKKVMETKKNIQKNDRKESGRGLAAGIETENMSQQSTDAIKKLKLQTALNTLWSEEAEETVRVEIITETAYAFASERACLRLAYNYRFMCERVKVAYSENLGSWFFRMENVL